MNPSEELHQALLLADAGFDENAGLLRGEVGLTRYHTRLQPGTPVHPTRESMIYSAALLETGEPWRTIRALAILNLLLPLQEKDPSRPTCGIWPWYFEESLDQMDPPDWNWADFLGVQLIRILLNERVPQSVGPSVRDALRLAAFSIRRRNVRLSYTNIAIMGTYVCLMAGRILSDETLLTYGRVRLREFVDFTREAGGFPEYNSPTYTVVSLMELSRMLRDFSEEDDRHLVREIHDMAWREIALHWHAPSRQWAGPHSRSYATLLQPATLGFLRCGLGGQAVAAEGVAPSLEWVGLPIRCPEHLLSHFTDLSPRVDRRFVVSKGTPNLEAHVHLEPEFALSSAERATFWNQSRALVGYAPAGTASSALTVRFLHDGYDFCAANLLCVQDGARVLGSVSFARDGGDVHGELDRIADARIRGSDWRLRFVFLNQTKLPEYVDGSWHFYFGNSAQGALHWLGGAFADQGPEVEMTQEGGDVFLDFILWRGPEREFVLEEPFSAFAAFALSMSALAAAPAAGATLNVRADQIQLDWHGLHLEAPRFPLPEADILAFARNAKARQTLPASPL